MEMTVSFSVHFFSVHLRGAGFINWVILVQIENFLKIQPFVEWILLCHSVKSPIIAANKTVVGEFSTSFSGRAPQVRTYRRPASRLGPRTNLPKLVPGPHRRCRATQRHDEEGAGCHTPHHCRPQPRAAGAARRPAECCAGGVVTWGARHDPGIVPLAKGDSPHRPSHPPTPTLPRLYASHTFRLARCVCGTLDVPVHASVHVCVRDDAWRFPVRSDLPQTTDSLGDPPGEVPRPPSPREIVT